MILKQNIWKKKMIKFFLNYISWKILWDEIIWLEKLYESKLYELKNYMSWNYMSWNYMKYNYMSRNYMKCYWAEFHSRGMKKILLYLVTYT